MGGGVGRWARGEMGGAGLGGGGEVAHGGGAPESSVGAKGALVPPFGLP